MSDAIKHLASSKLNRPEEIVRQELLHKLLALGYPKSLLLVEKELSALPHIQEKTPNRRLDIVCLAKGLVLEHPFYPLLLIECKAHQIDRKTISQVLGYNRFVRSIFVGVASRSEFYLGRYDHRLKEYTFSSSLPTYQELFEEALCSITNT